jgi:hypothetical protein
MHFVGHRVQRSADDDQIQYEEYRKPRNSSSFLTVMLGALVIVGVAIGAALLPPH